MGWAGFAAQQNRPRIRANEQTRIAVPRVGETRVSCAVGLDPLVELLIIFFMMFHCSLDELSEFPVLSTLFNVGQLIVFRLLHQLQKAPISIRLQCAIFNCV